MKLTDVIELARMGYKAEDVKELLATEVDEKEEEHKKELDELNGRNAESEKTLNETRTALETANAEIEKLKKQISDLQKDNVNKDVGVKEVDEIEKLKEFFKGGD